jgi:L-cysteine S-thiosulfotransferase
MGRNIVRLAGAVAFAIALSSAACAEDAEVYVPQKVIDGAIAAPLTAVAGNAEEGKKVIASRAIGNCVACHQSKAMAKEAFQGDIAPPLDGVGTRYSVEQLRAIIVNSKDALNPESAMPAFYVADPAPRVLEKFKGKTIMTAQQVEDVVAFLTTLKE